MKKLTALTLALAISLLNPNAHANDKTEETLLKMECRNGKWIITYAKSKQIIKQTQAYKLQGKRCIIKK
ncbi:MAG: hypothetical protein JHC25_00705 [Thermodesulfobacterium sp.]|nr:hypothetical protein [Thermodesulfobacterium sp.]